MQQSINYDVQLNFVLYQLRNQSPPKLKKVQTFTERKDNSQISTKTSNHQKLWVTQHSTKSSIKKQHSSCISSMNWMSNVDISKNLKFDNNENVLDQQSEQVITNGRPLEPPLFDKLNENQIKQQSLDCTNVSKAIDKEIKMTSTLKSSLMYQSNIYSAELVSTVASNNRLSQILRQNFIRQDQESYQNNQFNSESIFNEKQMEDIHRLLFQDLGPTPENMETQNQRQIKIEIEKTAKGLVDIKKESIGFSSLVEQKSCKIYPQSPHHNPDTENIENNEKNEGSLLKNKVVDKKLTEKTKIHKNRKNNFNNWSQENKKREAKNQGDRLLKTKQKQETEKIFIAEGYTTKYKGKNIKKTHHQKSKVLVNTQKSKNGIISKNNKQKLVSSKQQQDQIWIKHQKSSKNIRFYTQTYTLKNLQQKTQNLSFSNQKAQKIPIKTDDYTPNLIVQQQKQLKNNVIKQQTKKRMFKSDVHPFYLTNLQNISESENQNSHLLKRSADSKIRLMVSQDLKELFSVQIEQKQQQLTQLMDQQQFKKQLQQIIHLEHQPNELQMNYQEENLLSSSFSFIHVNKQIQEHLPDMNQIPIFKKQSCFCAPIQQQHSKDAFKLNDKTIIENQKLSQITSIQRQEHIQIESPIQNINLKRTTIFKKSPSLSLRQLRNHFHPSLSISHKQKHIKNRSVGHHEHSALKSVKANQFMPIGKKGLLTERKGERKLNKFQKQLTRFKTRINC